MEFINKVEIKGIVGRSTVSSVNGKSVVNFSVMTENTFANGNQIVIDSTWFQVTYWQDGPAETIFKGDIAHVWGRMRMRKYVTPQNEERIVYEIIADKVVIEEHKEEE